MNPASPPIDPSIAAAYRAMLDGRSFLAAPAGLSAALPAGRLGVFSSGSTGSARCIVRTWDSWTSSFHVADDLFAVDAAEHVGLIGPWTSTMVLFAALHALDSGATPLLGSAGELARGAHLDVVHAVPTAASTYLDSIRLDGRPAPRLLVTAGAAAPERLWRTAADLGITMVEYYGAAELSFVGWHRHPGGFEPVPGVEIEIRDSIIWARSGYCAEGYLAAADGPLRREGEWASVGDHGCLDDAGRLVVLGRGDTAVTTGGHTVLVEDVERALAAVPGVREIAVVGLPHEELGEVLVAAFAADVDTSTLIPTLRSAAQRLPGPMRPRAWFPLAALPRTMNGKIDRARLRAEVNR